MSTNFVVSSLPAYVKTNEDMILKNFALVGNGTRSRIGIQTGVKGSEYLNFLDINPTLQDGSDCGFSADGAVTLTQRKIETSLIKVNLDICPKTLVGKYAEYLVKINATENDLPFEQYIVEGLTNELNKRIEKMIWQGDKTKSSDNTLKWINGFLKVASTDASGNDVTGEEATAKAAIMKVYNALPEEVLDRGGEIYVAPAIFRKFVQELVDANLYHYDFGNEELSEVMLPGSDCKVVRTQGLSGTKTILGTFASNLVYGCDMMHDEEVCDLWFSQDDRVFKLDTEWNSGVQIALPDMVTWGTFASL